MKQTISYSVLIFLLSSFFISHPLKAQESMFKKEFLESWKRSQEYSIAVFEAMPDSLYDYKVEADAMTFGEQAIHMSETMYRLATGYIDNQTPMKPRVIDKANAKKEHIIAYLNMHYDMIRQMMKEISEEELNQKVAFFSGDELSKRQVFKVMDRHNYHHRGYALVYLRENGIKAPAFVGW